MENPKIKPETYWEWRCCINEMHLAEEKKKFAELQSIGMTKDLDIMRLKAAMFRATLVSMEDTVKLTKVEYDKMKKRIEDEIGMSLNGCAIDDVTFEVRKLEEDLI